MKREVNNILQELLERVPQLRPCEEAIAAAFGKITASYRRGGRLYLCGNGGSAADCEHIAGELMKSFRLPREPEEKERERLSDGSEAGREAAKWLERGLPALSLTSNGALNTAIANDRAAVLTFAQQVYVLGQEGDVLWCITTSGNSQNCIYAAAVARTKGMQVISLTGREGGQVKKYSDVCIAVPETQTYLVQELHLPVYHCLCAMLEEEFFSVADAAVSCSEDGKRQGSPKNTDEPEMKQQ